MCHAVLHALPSQICRKTPVPRAPASSLVARKSRCIGSVLVESSSEMCCCLLQTGMLDVQQIFGRAGRPQFEDTGLGIIITSHDKLVRPSVKLRLVDSCAQCRSAAALFASQVSALLDVEAFKPQKRHKARSHVSFCCLQAHYLGMLMHQLPIESQFVRGLVDNLNAEIVLGGSADSKHPKPHLMSICKAMHQVMKSGRSILGAHKCCA